MTQPTFADLHAGFSVVTSAFKSKNDASACADRIRRVLARRFVNFNPLAVEVGGHTKTGFITFPRLHTLWAPRDTSVRGLAEELTRIANEFATIYDIKPQEDKE